MDASTLTFRRADLFDDFARAWAVPGDEQVSGGYCPDEIAYIVELAGEPVCGICLSGADSPELGFHPQDEIAVELIVRPDRRGEGIATATLSRIRDLPECSTRALSCDVRNGVARRIVEKAGWELVEDSQDRRPDALREYRLPPS